MWWEKEREREVFCAVLTFVQIRILCGAVQRWQMEVVHEWLEGGKQRGKGWW
jgi:hypothetical protein